ncbi:GNAT family N-acetyltransferase [Aureimonas sp. ME7]|uniref:GNAT family N-acetyltransferase n=1 Tax=Aureimonas sp. ME7 TaxID=2744252 RepID=UPI0015F6FABB|nr:GNAT family N-acetyltransferase [Aureimonas sp. ME7]
MSRFFVRTAGKADVPAVSALLRETWHDTYDGIYGAERVREITDAWHSVEVLASRLSQPNAEFLVADSGAELGGMAYAKMAAADRTLVVLHQLYVRPTVQGCGVGADLLSEMLDCFPEAKRMRIEVEGANVRAIAFYERHGFVRTGRADSELGIPATVFERQL